MRIFHCTRTREDSIYAISHISERSKNDVLEDFIFFLKLEYESLLGLTGEFNKSIVFLEKLINICLRLEFMCKID